MPDEATVFVVDDDPAMRESLRWLIESVGLAVEAYPSAQRFLEAYDSAKTGCLVLDVRMPGMGGLDLQTELATRKTDLPIIVITGYAEVSMAVRAIKGGAIDFIEKPFNDQLLLDRIHQAIETDRRNREQQKQNREVAARMRLLTPREREILHMVTDGKSNKMIAMALGISEKTVEVHRAHVMQKMHAASLADLVRLTVLARGK